MLALLLVIQKVSRQTRPEKAEDFCENVGKWKKDRKYKYPILSYLVHVVHWNFVFIVYFIIDFYIVFSILPVNCLHTFQ